MKNDYELPVMELLSMNMEDVIKTSQSEGRLEWDNGGSGNEGGVTGWE